jgi:N-acetylglucosaminyldiphosphoundecaprenol N-acetyl-beta-D-mannosaminyltransferase
MTNKILKYPFFSYQIFAGEPGDLFKIEPSHGPLLISTINPHSFYVADHDHFFRTTLQRSQILLPDGVGIVYANRLINGTRIQRISGMDIFLFILKKLQTENNPAMKRVFFLGASDETLGRIKEKLNKEYPSLELGLYSPPFKTDFSEEELGLMIEEINRFQPYVLFVGMTAPKQEKWSYANMERVNAKMICSIGAVFDFYSGNVRRPGKTWQTLGLEWLRRFLKEPKRLWRRSFISLPYFLVKVFRETFRTRILRINR